MVLLRSINAIVHNLCLGCLGDLRMMASANSSAVGTGGNLAATAAAIWDTDRGGAGTGVRKKKYPNAKSITAIHVRASRAAVSKLAVAGGAALARTMGHIRPAAAQATPRMRNPICVLEIGVPRWRASPKGSANTKPSNPQKPKTALSRLPTQVGFSSGRFGISIANSQRRAILASPGFLAKQSVQSPAPTF